MANRWYEANYTSGSSGKVLKLHVYTIESNIESNWTKERADLWLSVTNTSGGYWNNYGSPTSLTINGNNTEQNVKWDARSVGDKLLIGTWDTIVYHNEDGTATISVSAYHNSGTSLGNASVGNQDYKCDTIPRTSQVTLSLNNFNIGDGLMIYANRRSTNFSHNIYINYGGSREVLASDVKDQWWWDTNTTKDLLYSKIPNANQGTGMIEMDTFSNGTYIGSTAVQFWANVVNSNPIFSHFDYEGMRNSTYLTGDNSILVKGQELRMFVKEVDKAIAQNYATMEYYLFDSDGNGGFKVNYADIGDVEATYTTPGGYTMYPMADTNILKVYAVDSRGNSTMLNITLDNDHFINPDPIKILNVKAERDTLSTNVKLTYNGTFWNKSFGNIQNVIKSTSYTFKKKETLHYGTTNIDPVVFDDGTFYFEGYIEGDLGIDGFELDENYYIDIRINDEIHTAWIDNILLLAANPAIAITKTGVSIMKPYDENLGGALQSNGGNVYGEVILFNNENGTASENIELNDNVNNYKYLEVFYVNNDGYNGSTKVLSKVGDEIELLSFQVSDNIFWLKFRRFKITESTLESQSSIEFNSNSHTTDRVINLLVKRVIGYK